MNIPGLESMVGPSAASQAKIAGTAGAVLGVAVAIGSIFMPDHYISVSRILPSEAKGMAGLNQLAGAAAAVGLNLPSDSGDGNYVEIINSRWLRDQLLAKRYSYQIKSWRFGTVNTVEGTLGQYLGETNPDAAASKIGELIHASRDMKTKVFIIQAETKSPGLSKQIADDAVALLGIFLREKTNSHGGAKAEFNVQRLAEARVACSKSEAELRDFINVNRNFTISTDPVVRLKGMRLEGELRLKQQVVASLAISLEQALLESKDDIPILTVLDMPQVPHRKSSPARLKLVLMAFAWGGIGALAIVNRKWIWRNLFASDEKGKPMA